MLKMQSVKCLLVSRVQTVFSLEIYLPKYNLLVASKGKLCEKYVIVQHLSQDKSSPHFETQSHLESHRHIFACFLPPHSNYGMYFLL